MKNRYTNLAEGMKTGKALRYSKIQYIKSAEGIAAHPAFGSPFIQIGNTQPIQIKSKSNVSLWIISGLVVVVLLFGFIIIRRKKELA